MSLLLHLYFFLLLLHHYRHHCQEWVITHIGIQNWILVRSLVSQPWTVVSFKDTIPRNIMLNPILDTNYGSILLYSRLILNISCPMDTMSPLFKSVEQPETVSLGHTISPPTGFVTNCNKQTRKQNTGRALSLASWKHEGLYNTEIIRTFPTVLALTCGLWRVKPSRYCFLQCLSAPHAYLGRVQSCSKILSGVQVYLCLLSPNYGYYVSVRRIGCFSRT